MRINNSLGTVGVAPGCRSVSARSFVSTASCDGSWTSSSSWTVNALAWAQSIGARVTNNSNAYGFTSSTIAQKYADTRNAGIVHFASAGNNASAVISYPASLPTVNAVGALHRSGALASFSNYGPGIGFAAPGQDVYTTDRTSTSGWVAGDYVWAYGTSFASPYTAGVAALVLSRRNGLSAPAVEQVLQQSCVDLGAAGYNTVYGWGFVNARAAVAAACPVDYNQDGFVDGIDYDRFNADFENPDLARQIRADYNHDGFVDSIDYDQFNRDFEAGCL